MKVSRRSFSNGLLVSALAGGISPWLSETADGAAHSVFNYGAHKLDWYPAKVTSGPAPVIVYVHGGAWALGNRGQVNAKPGHFTSNGYHFASVSYTLFPAANAQTQALQIGSAINWIHAHAGALGADPERIGLMGHSAGCHLSSLATLAGAAMAVKALVCNDTRAYDLPFLAHISGGGLPALYASAFRSRKMWRAWSPISYTGLKQQPPVLVAWSRGAGRDRLSMRFADALEYDGINVTRYDGRRRYNHFSIDRRMGRERGGLTEAVDRFFAEKLAPSAPPD